MKIRHPWLIKIVSLLGFLVMRLWLSTLHIRMWSAVPGFDWTWPRRGKKYVFTFWHEDLLVPTHFMGPAYRILISHHADGELIAEICHLCRAGTIRGSTTRGSIEATRQMLRARERWHIVVVPDGPRGPRRRLKPGPVFLAAHTGLAVVPVGIGYSHAWRLPTWDRFVLPRPGSSAHIILAEPVYVPASTGKEQIDAYCRLVERRMHEAAELAERLAKGEPLPAVLRSEPLLDKMEKHPASLLEVRRLAG
jgi:lysophospholipid acyltransferase (LPLAT)-like uncharacterized protein